MARLLYGCTAADYAATPGGQIVAGATLTVFDAEVGGSQITDLLDDASVATTVVTTNAYGQVRFYGPDGEARGLWLAGGQGPRILVRPASALQMGLPQTTTDNAVARYDGTSGALQDSSVIIDDGPNVAVGGSPAYLDAASRTLIVNSDTDGAAGIFASSEGRILQILAANDDDVAGMGTRSNHPVTICANDTTQITVSTAGKVTLAAPGPTAGIEMGAAGPTITSGAGAPSHSAPNGSLYMRTDGTASTTLYVRAAGAWAALS